MYRRVDFAADFITKASSQVVWAFLVTINFLTLFRLMLLEDLSSYNADIIFSLSFLNYVLSHIASNLIDKSKRKYPKIIFIIPVIASIISLATVIFLMKDFPNHIRIALFFYYLILWKKGVDFSVDEYDVGTYKKGFWITFILISTWLIFLILLMGVREDFSYKWVFMRYFPVYLIVSVLTLFRLVFLDAYDNRFKNTINSEKNIFRVNVFSIVSISVVIVLILTNYFGTGVGGVNFIYNVVNQIIDLILIGLSYIVAGIDMVLMKVIGTNLLNIFMTILNFIVRFIDFVTRFGEDANPEKVKVTDKMVENIANIGKNVALILIFLVIIFVIISKLRNVLNKKQRRITLDGEQKDFILKDELLNGSIISLFKGMRNNLSNMFSKEKISNTLPIIRKIYIKVLKATAKKGHVFKKHYTPNEYLQKEIKGSSLDEIGFDQLTRYYNEVRYGKKKLNDKNIEEAQLIQDRINT